MRGGRWVWVECSTGETENEREEDEGTKKKEAM